VVRKVEFGLLQFNQANGATGGLPVSLRWAPSRAFPLTSSLTAYYRGHLRHEHYQSYASF